MRIFILTVVSIVIQLGVIAVVIWFIISRRVVNYKRELIKELDLLLSTHLKVNYDEFFRMVNRKFPHHYRQDNPNLAFFKNILSNNMDSVEPCSICNKSIDDIIHNNVSERHLIVEFSDMTISELEQVIERYSVMKQLS